MSMTSLQNGRTERVVQMPFRNVDSFLNQLKRKTVKETHEISSASITR